MERYAGKLILGLIIIPFLLILTDCEKTGTTGNGLLEGTISIGPICPVETIPPSPDCMPTAETYKAYPVGVWTSDGSFKIADLSPALDGAYSVRLAAGQYLLKLEKNYGVGSSNLPAVIEVVPVEKTIFNINIDTGIR